ncbi:MAG: DUF4160 domain-containing protein [Stellaceae bacterium]
MPTVSSFFGITIRIYYNDHPPPHFHVYQQTDEAKIGIEGLRVLDGYLPPRVLRLVRGWAKVHQVDLRENWSLAERHQALKNIAPLE